MVENIINRAKRFIGLEEGVEEAMAEGEAGEGNKEDIQEVLRPKKREKSNADFEVALYEPRAYEDSLQMAAHLRQGDAVVINLQHLDPSDGTRLIDFVSGTTYAIDGHMIKIGDSVFLFTPSNISIADFVQRGSIGEEVEASEAARKSFFGGR